jgi:hypothetical protein
MGAVGGWRLSSRFRPCDALLLPARVVFGRLASITFANAETSACAKLSLAKSGILYGFRTGFVGSCKFSRGFQVRLFTFST